MNHLFMDANGFGQIEIGFETLEVTKCRARWACEQDIEDLNQTMRGCGAAAVASLLMKMIWKIQRKIPKLSESHDEYDRDENGTNGEGTSNLIKRFIPRLGNWIGNLSTEGQCNID